MGHGKGLKGEATNSNLPGRVLEHSGYPGLIPPTMTSNQLPPSAENDGIHLGIYYCIEKDDSVMEFKSTVF